MKRLSKYAIWIVSVFVAFILSFSVMLTTVKADATTPVISVSDTTIRTYVGSEPALNVTATSDNGEAELDFAWSAGALDGLGRLTEGEHTCTITATDGEASATVTLTYIVTEDTSDNDGYAFVTIICEGMETVVKAYKLNDTIDMSAYADKENYTKTVKNSAGEVITDFTATADCTLYVTYTEITTDDSTANSFPQTTPKKSGCSCVVELASSAGLLLVVGLTVVGLRKSKERK